MISLVKIVTIAISIVIITTLAVQYAKKNISFKKTLLWLLVCLVGLFLVLFPEYSNKIASIMGMGRGIDTIFLLAFLFIFYMILQFNVKLEKIDKSLTDIVVQIAKLLNKPK